MTNSEIEKPREFSREEMIKYGQEHFSEYRVGDDEEKILDDFKKEADRVFEANDAIEERLNNLEYKDRIIKFLQGEIDKEFDSIFNRQNFDWQKLLKDILEKGEKISSEQLNEIIYAMNKIIVKDESYKKAIKEREKIDIEYKGFEEDKDVSDIKDVLSNIFTNDLANKCLISQIDYNSHVVHIWFGSNAESYYLPQDEYEEWKREMPGIVAHKTRAENFSTWNADHDFSDTYLSYPINMYSFIDEDLSQFDYLRDVPEDKRMRYYKIGTITHEFGHNIYYNLMSADLRKKWQEIIDSSTSSMTSYTEKYRSGTHGDKINYDEEFAEAVRLLTTVPEYLESNSRGAYEFLRSEFPEIKSI